MSLDTGEPFQTEKSQRYYFTRALKALGIRHRPPYNARHTYATMLIMAGANINWIANQLGNSPLMIATVYSKWIAGEADKTEMAKLNTAVIEYNGVEKNLSGNRIGGKLAGNDGACTQITENKRKKWSGRQDLNLSDE